MGLYGVKLKLPAIPGNEATSVWANFLTCGILAINELKIQPGEQLLVTAVSFHLGHAMIQISKILGF